MTPVTRNNRIGQVLLPSEDITQAAVRMFNVAPPDERQSVVYEFRRLYFICRHQNDLEAHAELYAQAIRDLGAEVRFNTVEEVQSFNRGQR